MAPSFIVNQNRVKINKSTDINKYKRAMIINARLRMRIKLLSIQNKDLSATRNNLLQQKMELQNKYSSLNNYNTQLIAINHSLFAKLKIIDHSLQECVPALVTLSDKIPSMIENVHQVLKLSESSISYSKENKEKQTKTIRPLINGITDNQPMVSIRPHEMSTIIESPISEQTPRRSTRFSTRNPLHNKLDTESFVRMKDVAALLKNSKAVSDYNSSNLGEGPSWLNTWEGQNQNSRNNNSLTEIPEKSHSFFNKTCSPINRNSSTLNVVEADLSTSSNSNASPNRYCNESDSHGETSFMLKNITLRKHSKRRSSEVTSDIDTSTSSTRSKRSGTKPVTYKENLKIKLRRD